MHIILGGTGHVGKATAQALLDRGERVTVVTRSAEKAEDLRLRGATVAVADILDTEAVKAVFRKGRRLYALNPPAPPDTDTDAEEKRTIAAILSAIEGSGLEKIVGHSTYGARKGENIGDLGTLFELEEGLRNQPIPTSILRAAYYMTNWDMSVETARSDGTLPSFLPPDFRLAMVAPQDLGQAAADLLTEPVGSERLIHAEGPERYTPADVAAVLSKFLDRPVTVSPVAREDWEKTYRKLGFSDESAQSYAGMTALAVDMEAPDSGEVRRGKVGLKEYFADRLKA
jgi:uncharacterized protein YbjT (DUF2867 family)